MITGVFLALDGRFLRHRWGAGLFAGVLAFNLAVTFAIGQIALGLVGCMWTGLMLGPIVARVRRQRAPTPLD